MASNNETVEQVCKDIKYHLKWCAQFGIVEKDEVSDYVSRFEAANRRDIAEFKRKVREANLKYRAEKARHTDTYKDARIKAQDEEIATLKREVAELRECLEQAYGDKTGTYTMRGNEVARWREALHKKGETK